MGGMSTPKPKPRPNPRSFRWRESTFRELERQKPADISLNRWTELMVRWALLSRESKKDAI
jgi:hypothetical protein